MPLSETRKDIILQVYESPYCFLFEKIPGLISRVVGKLFAVPLNMDYYVDSPNFRLTDPLDIYFIIYEVVYILLLF